MNLLLNEYQNSKKWKESIQNIEKNEGPILISGLTGVGKSVFIANCQQETAKPICVITYNEIQARNLLQDLEKLQKQVFLFPKKEIVAYDYVAESKDGAFERMEILNKIESGKVKILVTTIEAMMQEMIAKEVLYHNTLKLKVGNRYKLEDLKEKLLAMGYERTDLVENQGQFSVRGRNCRHCYGRE